MKTILKTETKLIQQIELSDVGSLIPNFGIVETSDIGKRLYSTFKASEEKPMFLVDKNIKAG
jgi:hypothetical protein